MKELFVFGRKLKVAVLETINVVVFMAVIFSAKQVWRRLTGSASGVYCS